MVLAPAPLTLFLFFTFFLCKLFSSDFQSNPVWSGNSWSSLAIAASFAEGDICSLETKSRFNPYPCTTLINWVRFIGGINHLQIIRYKVETIKNHIRNFKNLRNTFLKT